MNIIAVDSGSSLRSMMDQKGEQIFHGEFDGGKQKEKEVQIKLIGV